MLHNKKVLIVSIFTLLSIVTLSSLYFAYTVNKDSKNSIIESVSASELNVEYTDKTEFYVEVKGAVKKPGVYLVNNDAIINDVIKLAGGLLKTAYSNNINLSRKVTNELVIYVFTKNEYKNKKKTSVTEVIASVNKECTSNGYLVDNCTDKNISVIESSEDIVPSVINTTDNITSNGLININTASLEELSILPGIGEAKAKAIIEYRTSSKFNTIEDLLNVSGISEKTYEKLQSYITV